MLGAWVALLALLAAPSPRGEPLPLGSAATKIELHGETLDLYTHKPESYRGERLLIVVHGVNRNADEYRDHAVAMGARFGALIVAPRFDAERFPSRRFQRGGIVGEDGRAAPPREWTYAMIPALADAIRAREGRPNMRCWLIGHSAGGQFAMRMAAFQPSGIERIVAANPGSSLFPTRELPFGYGFGGLPPELSDDARIRSYLAAPLTLFLGTADDHPDENFDASEDAMKQGPGRLQRNRNAFELARALAAERGWDFGWRLVEAEGVGHDHEKMFDHERCELALFGPTEGAGEPGESEKAK